MNQETNQITGYTQRVILQDFARNVKKKKKNFLLKIFSMLLEIHFLKD